ncbi:Hypothetical protein NTJ_16172 [Nesidiocoris tenuis]|uniref:Uncharacterized protein n=1 Tax=Nesidiocoris tenuis TaxID=355587 RepID=A0ABN7BGD0_9HEMI|nr:Hypothetical protein NTJ_16172 [Nesidiocoris tenuis]
MRPSVPVYPGRALRTSVKTAQKRSPVLEAATQLVHSKALGEVFLSDRKRLRFARLVLLRANLIRAQARRSAFGASGTGAMDEDLRASRPILWIERRLCRK